MGLNLEQGQAPFRAETLPAVRLCASSSARHDVPTRSTSSSRRTSTDALGVSRRACSRRGSRDDVCQTAPTLGAGRNRPQREAAVPPPSPLMPTHRARKVSVVQRIATDPVALGTSGVPRRSTLQRPPVLTVTTDELMHWSSHPPTKQRRIRLSKNSLSNGSSQKPMTAVSFRDEFDCHRPVTTLCDVLKAHAQDPHTSCIWGTPLRAPSGRVPRTNADRDGASRRVRVITRTVAHSIGWTRNGDS